MMEQVDAENSDLHTDEFHIYPLLARQFRTHRTVNHSKKEFVKGRATTNPAESFFAQLKRSLDGTHHHVSPEHLQRYVNEFAFRYTTCKAEDTERVQMLVNGAANRRLTYRPLTGHYPLIAPSGQPLGTTFAFFLLAGPSDGYP